MDKSIRRLSSLYNAAAPNKSRYSKKQKLWQKVLEVKSVYIEHHVFLFLSFFSARASASFLFCITDEKSTTMTKSLIKLLALPALLAGAAQALHFTNDIPVDAYYQVGTDFVLTWSPETRTDTFNLTVDSFLANPILVSPNGGPLGSPVYDYKGKEIVLSGEY